MKKVLGSLLVGLMAVSLFSGCDIAPSQIKVVAQNAGLFSAVGWIAIDNPDKDAISAVKSVLTVIKDKGGDVEGGATYTEVVYPEVVTVINSDLVPAQYRPVCKAGALSLLGGLDMLFATNPDWRKDQNLAIQVVDAFIFGANNGLSLSETDERMIAARRTASSRARVLK